MTLFAQYPWWAFVVAVVLIVCVSIGFGCMIAAGVEWWQTYQRRRRRLLDWRNRPVDDLSGAFRSRES